MAKRNDDFDELVGLYEGMLNIRTTENRLSALFAEGRVPGFIHTSTGQEATAVGVATALRADDTLSSTHRGHGHALAKGVSSKALIQEILGRDEGPCRGRGGSLHVADFSTGMLGANGIVGAGIPIALGSALAHKTLGSDRVSVAFFGDGALAQGLLYEAMNLSALWKLPLLLVCENNGWSEFTPSSMQYVGNLAEMAGAFAIGFRRADGNDVEAVLEATRRAVEALRHGEGPFVLECLTLRARGHYEGDPQAYREGVEERSCPDPIALLHERLTTAGCDAEVLEAVAARVEEAVERAAAEAAAGSEPDFEQARNDVYGRA